MRERENVLCKSFGGNVRLKTAKGYIILSIRKCNAIPPCYVPAA